MLRPTTLRDALSQSVASARADDDERMSTLYASLFCGAGHIMRIAGEISQRMDDDRQASRHQIDTVKRWLKSMSDDVAAYGPGERT